MAFEFTYIQNCIFSGSLTFSRDGRLPISELPIGQYLYLLLSPGYAVAISAKSFCPTDSNLFNL